MPTDPKPLTPAQRVNLFLAKFPFLVDARPDWWEYHGKPELIAVVEGAVADAVKQGDRYDSPHANCTTGPHDDGPPEPPAVEYISEVASPREIREERAAADPLAHPKVWKVLGIIRERAGACDPETVAGMTRENLGSIDGCGPAVLRRIEEWLAAHGLRLREEG